jgi:uroporphyrinogen-III synthase
MRVLVTRPKGDAEETSAKLVALGHDAITVPLLEIRFREGEEISLAGVQTILVTSANGIRALARRTNRRDVAVLAVGAQSAEIARKLGFERVTHSSGDADALASFAIASLKPENGALLHAAGQETRGQLATRLTNRGFAVRGETLYDAVAANDLPPPLHVALAEKSLDAVLFFSPRTAGIFAALVAQAGVEDACRNILALCLSENVAAELGSLHFREIRVAQRPDHDALLALLA